MASSQPESTQTTDRTTPTHVPGADAGSTEALEQRRLAALDRYLLIEREVDPALTALVRLATAICDIPQGAINLIGADRQWQITAFGTDPADAPRSASFCDVTISVPRPVVVRDAREDPRFADRGFATGEWGALRTYAGAQLTTRDGYVLGSLCVFDETVHDLSPHQVDMLQLLADQAMSLLEMRYQATKLAEVEQRFRLAFVSAPVGMALVGLDGRFLQVNPALCDLVGRDDHELVQLSIEDLTHPDDRVGEREELAKVEAGVRASYRMEKRYLHRDGHDVWVELWASLVKDPHGEPLHFVKQVEDISVRKQVQLGLVHQAMHDPLTGLPNRLLLADRLEHAAAVQKRGGCLADLSLDLDHFKQVNDTHGHAVGDALLIAVAERLRGCLRPEDTIARWGGDEFVIVSHALHADLEDVEGVARRLVAAVAEPFTLDDHTVAIGVTVGGSVVTTSAVPERPEVLIEQSDRALYRAKRAGRGSIEVARSGATT